MRPRLQTYLRLLADRDWGIPSGFGGRTCFQAIPPLEMERLGEAPSFFRREWIDYSLDLLRFDNPYCRAPFGERRYTIRCGAEEWTGGQR